MISLKKGDRMRKYLIIIICLFCISPMLAAQDEQWDINKHYFDPYKQCNEFEIKFLNHIDATLSFLHEEMHQAIDEEEDESYIYYLGGYYQVQGIREHYVAMLKKKWFEEREP